MENVSFEAIRELAMLYVQSQNLKDCSPEQIYDMYNDALNRFSEYDREKNPPIGPVTIR